MTTIHGSDEMTSKALMPTLSVCMIVKNEEKLLAQCLDSVEGVADEIIIVDTGSTDRTVEIARKHTDKIFSHQWQDSFSEARNHSLSYATCDWILQIDADEELFQEDIPILRGALAAAQNVPDIDAILVALLSDLPGKITSKHYFPRIHRRGRAHYEGIVHNQLVYQGKDMVAEIRFRHYGYALSPEEMEHKAQRSEALLLTQIEEDPDNTFAWRNLLRIYRNRGDYDKVVEKGQWVLDHPRTTAEQRHSVASDMMVALTKMARYEEAEAVGLRALKEFPDDLDIIFYLGMLHMASGHLDNAVSRLKQFLSVKRAENRAEPRFSLLTMDHYASEAAVWNNLGRCDQRQGRATEAIEAYQHAIESDPDQEGFYTNLAFALLQLGEVAQAESVLQKAAGRGVATAAAFKMLGDTLYLQHRLQESEVAYRRAIDFDQTDTDAHLGLGRALGGMGRLSDAADSLAKALELNPASRIAWLAWVKVHHRLGDRRETVSGLDRLIALGGLGCQENLTLAAISISLEAYDRATAFLETYLQEKPEGVGALADLATCYVKMGRYAAALEGYRAVLHSDPENANVRRNLRALQRRLVRETAVQ